MVGMRSRVIWDSHGLHTLIKGREWTTSCLFLYITITPSRVQYPLLNNCLIPLTLYCLISFPKSTSQAQDIKIIT